MTDKRKEVGDKDDTLATWLRSIMLYCTKEQEHEMARRLWRDKARLDNHLNIKIGNNTLRRLMSSQSEQHDTIRVFPATSNAPAKTAATVDDTSQRIRGTDAQKKAVKYQILF